MIHSIISSPDGLPDFSKKLGCLRFHLRKGYYGYYLRDRLTGAIVMTWATLDEVENWFLAYLDPNPQI